MEISRPARLEAAIKRRSKLVQPAAELHLIPKLVPTSAHLSAASETRAHRTVPVCATPRPARQTFKTGEVWQPQAG
jgi:hypothetical protein